MDLEDKCVAKGSGLRSLSSSVQSTPEKNGHSDDASRSSELMHESPKSGSKKELLGSCMHKDNKRTILSKCKMAQNLKISNKSIKSKEQRKVVSSSNNQSSSRKQQRKGETPIRLPPATDNSFDFGCSNSWVCKNSACRANLSMDVTFCKRCSCCICHLFDDNKDPSLWLECASENSNENCCGLSCHIECALQRRKAGVVDLGQLMQLDGSYCCASCGKVSGILGSWRKQLVVAKDARRVDILCHRIFLSYQLLDGTSRFKELHEIVNNAKIKLETEVGPLNGISAKMARGIVSRLSIAADLQDLCSLGIEKADEWLAKNSHLSSKHREDSLPAACNFMFEEVTSSTVLIVLIDLSHSSSDSVGSYKLWYCKSREETYTKEPVCVFSSSQRKFLISNLQPCTEYTFRIISCTESGELSHSEARCFTKSVEIIHKNTDSLSFVECEKETFSYGKKDPKRSTDGSYSDFKVRDLGKVLHLARQQEDGRFERSKVMKVETVEKDKFDLNVASVPDLNEELYPPFESPRHGNHDDDDAKISHDNDKNGTGRSCRQSRGDCDSGLVDGSPFRTTNKSSCLDENFEYCVKKIRWLECKGHIEKDFRLKLLTWYSLRSTEQERRVVSTFIQTLIDDPSSLAGQLVYSFSEIISSKRPQNGGCSTHWH